MWLGEPPNRNTVAVNFLGTSISANAYFMFGKNITPPTDSQRTYNGLASWGCYGMTPSSSGTTGAISGNGFAGGLDVGFDSGERMRDIVARLKAKWRFAGGSIQRLTSAISERINVWWRWNELVVCSQANVAAYAIGVRASTSHQRRSPMDVSSAAPRITPMVVRSISQQSSLVRGPRPPDSRTTHGYKVRQPAQVTC
ncbi:MAG: hypothetical protein IPH49_14755 [Ignavibacteria bacterium]|nr:hypothetical protein [Ignavibacteria bacterium]